MYIQERLVISFVGSLLYDDGGLLIVQLEDDVFSAFSKFECIECLRAGWVDSNARARLS